MQMDMSEFHNVFLEEAQEQMDLMEQDFLALEKETSPELLQRIFRAAHTLKGSSKAMGFMTMGDLTHAMEDILDKLRQGELSVTPPMVDALFQGLDALKQMKDEIAEAGDTTFNSSRQTSALRAILDKGNGGNVLSKGVEVSASDSNIVLTDEQTLTLQEALSSEFTAYHIKVTLSSECMMKSIRAIMVLQTLETLGAVIALNPDEEGIENEQFEDSFEILFTTQSDPEDISKAVNRVSEVQAVQVTKWQAETPVEKPVVTESAMATPYQETVAASNAPTPAAQAKQSQTIRVDVTRLDKLINLIGELVIDRTRLVQLGMKLSENAHASTLLESLNETSAHIGRITDELQDEVMKARMLPIENVFNRFPRMVRDISQKLGKDINFVIEGKETELDRSVIEVISDPLIHMLRNSLDHGIEMPHEREVRGKTRQGNVWIRAYHAENHVVIEIEDDGRGIDPQRLRDKAVQMGMLSVEGANRLSDSEAINLIFASGLSTAKELSDVSGRGVGMDIVRTNLEKLGGTVSIDSRLGRGSRFKVKLPLTLAIIRALLVKVGEGVFALPLTAVIETLKIESSEIHEVQHHEVILQRGKTLPLIRMAKVFPHEGAMTPAEKTLAQRDTVAATQAETSSHFLVVVGYGEKQVGLLVDRLIGEQEIVIKALGSFIGDIPGISGATILGDGRVGLIVDINGLIQFAVESRNVVAYP